MEQISVFVENRSGRLFLLSKVLADNGIDLKALNIADTSDFGILRFIADDPRQAIKVIKDAGFTATITEVGGVKVPDVPGGLVSVLSVLNDNDIGIEYLYSFSHPKSGSAVIFFNSVQLKEGMQKLEDAGYTAVSADML